MNHNSSGGNSESAAVPAICNFQANQYANYKLWCSLCIRAIHGLCS